ncbi:DUF1987 domain-containing protein [Nafulsella turpanensis]|uniref:DUF1987 domain-containing protein n=1 Tax=Nafulsella turpanensis TaxID=1265690 RepID=UPI000347EDDD|nr:DUF1987 domain-containing protein [Nafulsella turpanensis]
MDRFFLEGTPKTPKLSFNGESGLFEISGRSIPENSIEFYRPVLDWLDQYITHPVEHITLIVKLEYFNTSSSKCLVDIFRRLERMYQQGTYIHVKWFYEPEDEDMQDSGLDFKEITRLPLEMIVVDGETDN